MIGMKWRRRQRTHKVSQFPGDQLFAEDWRNGAVTERVGDVICWVGLAMDEVNGEK
jgi:hypothetical protein